MILQKALDNFLAKQTTKTENKIHWLVWLLENPKSLLHLHGACMLTDHDYIHIILGRGQETHDEAYVIGFTMGNDDRTKRWEVKLFKFISHHFYPENDRFTKNELKIFDQGFMLGQSKLPLYKRIGEFDWSTVDKNAQLNDIKRKFDIQ